MAGTAAIVLPPGPADAPARQLLRALAGQRSRFHRVVLDRSEQSPIDGPEFHGIEHRRVFSSWMPGWPGRRHAAAVAAMLRKLRPAVIEVHDAPQLAIHLAGWFRPVPVILILHADPQRQPGARDAAGRTYLLAQATRVAALSAELRASMLEGVHPAMRHCALLPPPDGPGGPAALADALDALRLDALGAWSRRLLPPI